MVTSRTIISIPAQSTTRATQRERSLSAVTLLVSCRSRVISINDRRRARDSSLGLPEGDLAAGGRGDDAAPSRGPLARGEQHRGAEEARAVGRLADPADLDVRQPERTLGGALDH